MDMGKRLWMALVLIASAGTAMAAGPAAVRKQIESSLLVKGTIDITAAGTVAGYAIPGSETLPSGIKAMIAREVPQWRFEPVGLRAGATVARARMSLRFVAKQVAGDKFTIAIRGANFGGEEAATSTPGKRSMTAPGYPDQAARAGVGGTVYMALKIGRAGRVEEAVVEQVNLRAVDDENAMQRWRALLAQASLRAARRWTFMPPTTGDEVDAPYWSARVPVDFIAPGARAPDQKKWQAYVPGPRAVIPWRADATDAGAGAGADALASGDVYPLDGGPRLLTALDPA
jgi:hypothetical protein